MVIKKRRVSRPYDIANSFRFICHVFAERDETDKQKKTEVIMEEVDTHFQDRSNLLLHTEALLAPFSNQLLLGLA